MVGTAHFVNHFLTLPLPCVPWSQEAKRLLRQPLPCPANAGFGGFSGFETTRKLRNLIHPLGRYIVVLSVVVIRLRATTEHTNRWGQAGEQAHKAAWHFSSSGKGENRRAIWKLHNRLNATLTNV